MRSPLRLLPWELRRDLLQADEAIAIVAAVIAGVAALVDQVVVGAMNAAQSSRKN
jgi:hypothetical protein